MPRKLDEKAALKKIAKERGFRRARRIGVAEEQVICDEVL